MLKIIGLNVLDTGVSKKTGKPNDAVIFHCVNEKPQGDKFIGKSVQDQYVIGSMARNLLSKIGTTKYSDLINKNVVFVYQRNSTFLDDVYIE